LNESKKDFSFIRFYLGVQTVAYAFPDVKIVSTACDTELDSKTGFICPGLGNFGDRYFGTDQPTYSSDIDDAVFSPVDNLQFQALSPSSPSVLSKKSSLNQNFDSN